MSKPKLLVISSNYPSHENVYGDVFVHTRVKEYTDVFEVCILGYNLAGSSESYMYENIPVCKTNALHDFSNKIQEINPDVVAVHFIQHECMAALLSIHKPLAIFVHGYEALSWKRRLMNYTSPGDIPYLLKYIRENQTQLRAFRLFYKQVATNGNVSFVFVSQWLKSSSEKDLAINFLNSRLIPNGIDSNLFRFEEKSPDLRKKILLLRSFKGRNYANDLSVDAILKLSKKPYFKELEFSIYGEGYLFNTLTKPLTEFENVKLHNTFVENKDIPAIHRQHGVFLCPSRLDTQGVSMCEAMSSGLVAIASPIGGIPEYAQEPSAMMASSSDEIVACIDRLYQDPHLFSDISQRASKAIQERCSLAVTTKQEIELFISLHSKSNMREFQQCSRCVLDTVDDPQITFDESGVCNYCRSYEKIAATLKRGQEAEANLHEIVSKIKLSGKGKDYDCIIGLSGGVDSTYLAYKAKQLGLRPLAVHFDNGWNSELAVSNIENIVKKLDIPLYTFVVDWDEFKSLQLSFLKASVVDIEVVTDHAIIAKLYELALKYNIKYILNGSNIVTESVLPSSWIYDKKDHVHIREVYKKFFPEKKITTYPLFTSLLKWRVVWSKIQSVSLLDYMDYNKEEVKKTISNELNWRDYGGKHYESVFTRFYQGYILPRKFGIDKRKAHLSNLICSGQITKEQALAELSAPTNSDEVHKQDYNFLLKKLDISEQEFEKIMTTPAKKHTDYPVETGIYNRYPGLRLFGIIWRTLKKVRG